MVVESSGFSQSLDKDAKLMPGSAKPVESSGSVQYVRKEPKTTVILQASGMIETSSDGELNMGTKDQLVLTIGERVDLEQETGTRSATIGRGIKEYAREVQCQGPSCRRVA
jgi:hypothetical protein